MEKFSKLLEKKAKSQKPMSGPEKDAKLKAVHEMRKMASDEMATPLKNLKKVTVASDSPEGVKVGLDKAKELMEGSPEEEASESPEMEAHEDESSEVPDHQEAEEMSPEELEAKIAELQHLLAAKKMS